ncbi:unnamed protein product [Tilletia laevis]|uniref:WW domain-containing protein n=2 Tax=Tilletia TaxID=13289 RepID=A0A177VID8_9BASI|nr:hypothetical protein CF335_g5376 [Tilletia laevis]KAE8252722.1 hypothetical protein A4X03_0g6089 [Tilletia caries]CAD6969309.1 unnamed protein product [Tilletia controversa]KAE8195654.1 hypothetical protein CF336_g2996 [Tilletia laevis]CAD6884121.1 unnamed protein product [Tilletia caries]
MARAGRTPERSQAPIRAPEDRPDVLQLLSFSALVLYLLFLGIQAAFVLLPIAVEAIIAVFAFFALGAIIEAVVPVQFRPRLREGFVTEMQDLWNAPSGSGETLRSLASYVAFGGPPLVVQNWPKRIPIDDLVMHGKTVIELNTDTSTPVQNSSSAGATHGLLAAASASSASLASATPSSGPSASVPSPGQPQGTSPAAAAHPAAANLQRGQSASSSAIPTPEPSTSSSTAPSSTAAAAGPAGLQVQQSAPPGPSVQSANASSFRFSGASAAGLSWGVSNANQTTQCVGRNCFSTKCDAHNSDENGPLPPGWSWQLSHNGRKYFINHNEIFDIPTWVRPSNEATAK